MFLIFTIVKDVMTVLVTKSSDPWIEVQLSI